MNAIAATDEETRPFAWYRTLSPRGRRAFAGAFGGYGLDSYDYWVLPFSIGAIIAYFNITTGTGGLLGTVTLVVSAIGGAGAGILADRIGRVRTLQLTVATYTLFTVLCGFAPNFESLLVLRGLQGLGFGGEWAAGAILIAEYAKPKYRGRTVAFVQSSWAVGWGLLVLVQTIVFTAAPGDLAWRILFWTGVIPALLVLWVRRNVQDADEATERRERAASKGTFAAIFKGDLLRTTLFAALLSTGVQGGYYTLATWLPTYLKKTRELTVINSTGYYAVLIAGAFVGYICGGYLTDLLGRKKNIWIFAVLSAVLIFAYTQVPHGANGLILVLSFPLGFSMSAIFAGFGSFLAELYPTEVRGTGQGFTYNFGRAIGAVFPTVVGFYGVGGALALGAVGYGIAAIALFGLPETRGRALT